MNTSQPDPVRDASVDFMTRVARQFGGLCAMHNMLGLVVFSCTPAEFTFRFKGSRKANRAVVALGREGRFDMSFYKDPQGPRPTVLVASFEDVGADALPRVFERVTGLCLTVPVVVGL